MIRDEILSDSISSISKLGYVSMGETTHSVLLITLHIIIMMVLTTIVIFSDLRPGPGRVIAQGLAFGTLRSEGPGRFFIMIFFFWHPWK